MFVSLNDTDVRPLITILCMRMRIKHTVCKNISVDVSSNCIFLLHCRNFKLITPKLKTPEGKSAKGADTLVTALGEMWFIG